MLSTYTRRSMAPFWHHSGSVSTPMGANVMPCLSFLAQLLVTLHTIRAYCGRADQPTARANSRDAGARRGRITDRSRVHRPPQADGKRNRNPDGQVACTQNDIREKWSDECCTHARVPQSDDRPGSSPDDGVGGKR